MRKTKKDFWVDLDRTGKYMAKLKGITEDKKKKKKDNTNCCCCCLNPPQRVNIQPFKNEQGEEQTVNLEES